jgi:hypothetical protein
MRTNQVDEKQPGTTGSLEETPVDDARHDALRRAPPPSFSGWRASANGTEGIAPVCHPGVVKGPALPGGEVIEHDLTVIAHADWIVDLGPEGGDHGGTICFQGAPRQLLTAATRTPPTTSAVASPPTRQRRRGGVRRKDPVPGTDRSPEECGERTDSRSAGTH